MSKVIISILNWNSLNPQMFACILAMEFTGEINLRLYKDLELEKLKKTPLDYKFIRKTISTQKNPIEYLE